MSDENVRVVEVTQEQAISFLKTGQWASLLGFEPVVVASQAPSKSKRPQSRK